jgi:hypothetical protein
MLTITESTNLLTFYLSKKRFLAICQISLNRKASNKGNMGIINRDEIRGQNTIMHKQAIKGYAKILLGFSCFNISINVIMPRNIQSIGIIILYCGIN